MKLLVYGTLKEGEHANNLLGKDAEMLDAFYTLEGYKMYKSGYPMVVPVNEGEDFKVKCELWEVPEEAVFSSVDMYEGHPSLFKRTCIDEDEDIHMYVYNSPIYGQDTEILPEAVGMW